MTGGGGRINFWVGHEKFVYVNSRGAGAREIYFSVDQTNKVKTKKKVFSSKIFTNFGYPLKILAIFHEFLSEDQKMKKKGLRIKNFYEIRCESTKITKIRVANTNLGHDLHSSSPEPLNFFGAQSSLGGAQFSFGGAQAVIWGGTAPECPPVVPGLLLLY